MKKETIKERARMALLVLGIVVGTAIAVQAIILMMWACQAAGIQM